MRIDRSVLSESQLCGAPSETFHALNCFVLYFSTAVAAIRQPLVHCKIFCQKLGLKVYDLGHVAIWHP